MWPLCMGCKVKMRMTLSGVGIALDKPKHRYEQVMIYRADKFECPDCGNTVLIGDQQQAYLSSHFDIVQKS